MSRFARLTWVLLQKDLRVELRTREIVYSAVLFALVMVTVFLFSGFESAQLVRGAAPGVLWVCIAFVGALIFGRTFQREREERALQGVLLTGDVMDSLFTAKLALNLILLGGVVAILLPVVTVTFRITWTHLPSVAGVLAAGCFGFGVMGTVLSAALAAVRLREVLLPIILYPLCIPLLICGVRATADLTQGDPAIGGWLGIILAFDALFVVLGRWLFGEAIDGVSSGE
jgi:heme exporter protein CcmB